MADGLFLMQRYCGSDEDSSDTSEKFPTYDTYYQQNNSQQEEKYTKSSQEEKNIKPSYEADELNLLIGNKTSTKQEEENDAEQAVEILDSLPHKAIQVKKISKKLKSNTKSNLPTVINENLTSAENVENQEEHFLIIGKKNIPNFDKIKPILPKWLSSPTIIGIDLREKEIPISELDYLDDFSKKNLSDCGINFLFPVQLAVIPWLMQAHQSFLFRRPSDLCVSAPTGSGKTLAFVIPTIQSLKDRVVCAVRAMVVLPVIELAIQIYRVFQVFVRGTDLKVVLLTGKKSFIAEQNALVRQGIRGPLSLADIIVTTPGRLLDHIQRTEGFCLQHLRYLVIDEADRMMEDIQKGWLKQIEDAIYKDSHMSGCACFSTGKKISSVQSTACSFGYVNQSLQKLLYSATLSHDPEKLHTLSLYRPKLFITQEETDSGEWVGKCPLPEDLTRQHIVCNAGTKPIVLCHYIQKYKFQKVLCFTESVERAQRLHLILEEMGFLKTREISSNYRPVQQKIILGQFCSGKVNLLVCSDMVARGIDIEGVDCVVSYDLPPFLKTYIHRIGRTARAGKAGTAVALLTEDELPRFKKLLTPSGISLPSEVPVDIKDLEPYIGSFQAALGIVDSKIRKLKNGKARSSIKRNRNGVEKLN